MRLWWFPLSRFYYRRDRQERPTNDTHAVCLNSPCTGKVVGITAHALSVVMNCNGTDHRLV